jgi:peptide/nickel transport system substrate-binding protein
MTDDLIEIDMDRREFMAVAGALGSASLAGCTGNDGGEDGGTDGGGGGGGGEQDIRLNVAISAEVWNFDPALWTDTATSTVGQLIYDEPVELTPDEELAPGLVEKVPKPKNDGKAYEYTLREGLTFHNGDDVTVEDFKYSVDWILNEENNSPIRGRIPFVTDTEIVGDRTLRLNLEKPFATLNWWLTRGLEGIVPKGSRESVEEGKGPSGVSTNLTNDPSGVGTGPFKFVEWNSGTNVLLERFDDHWRDDLGNIAEINFEFVGENSARLAGLRSGETDLTDKVPPKDFQSLKDQDGITAESVPGNLTQILYLNVMSDGPMGNVHNRRALLFAIDAEEILDEIFYGQGVVQKGPWYPNSEWTSPKLKDMQLYDPEKAREELEMAGNPDGFEMEIVATSGSWFKDEAVIIQSQLADIGVDVTVTALDKSALFNQVYGTNEWDAAMEDWGQSIPVATYWLDAGYADNNHNHNNWHHASEDLDDKYRPSGPPAPEDAEGDWSNGHEWYVNRLKEAQAATSEKKQKEIVFELEEYVTENAIQIDIAYVNSLAAWQNEVDGFEMGTFTNLFREITKEGGE